MIGKLNNGYFVDPASGLAFKLNMVVMGKTPWGNDLAKVEAEVLRVGGLCANEANECLPTLGFLQSQWDAAKTTNEDYAEMLASQTRCFIYLSKEYSLDYLQGYPMPFGYPEISFIWNGANSRVYTPYTLNNLGHRYKSIQESAIPSTPTTPTTPSATDGFIHLKCPYCQKTIF